jgi:hypothetical protein
LVDVDNPARVIDYASQGLNVYLKDMDFDADGRPVLLYVTSLGHQPGPPNDPRHFRIVRWDGAAWRTAEVCRTDHNYDMGSIYLDGDAWRVWVPSAPGPQAYHGGGEMVVWESKDVGASWSIALRVTSDSPRNHNYARRPVHAKDPFYCFWADGDPTKLSISHLYFADSSGEHVRELPFDMDSEWATPTLASEAQVGSD